MAKTMAKIENGAVVNLLWCSDTQSETETLKDPGDRSIGAGDSYQNGKWYRNGNEILTEKEVLQAENEDMRKALGIMGVTVNG